MLEVIRKDAYQKALVMTPDELMKDKQLIRDLKDSTPFDEDTHFAIIMSRAVWQGFLYASQYSHNVIAFHESLLEECIFGLTHLCDVKPEISGEIEEWYDNHYRILRYRRACHEKNQ